MAATLQQQAGQQLQVVDEGFEDHDRAINNNKLRFIEAYERDGRMQKSMLKVDLHVLAVLILLYLISFIDHGNIGNARIEGLIPDLGLLSQRKVQLGLTVFFFAYGAFEVPANLMLKWIKPSIWLPVIRFIWGRILVAQGFMQNYSGLLATRFLLSIFEAGFFPGCDELFSLHCRSTLRQQSPPSAIFILSTFHMRREMGHRVAYLYRSASAARAFSGLVRAPPL
ncbi:hypothetical protein JCM3770_003861 [Rhodotorula araucariae]